MWPGRRHAAHKFHANEMHTEQFYGVNKIHRLNRFCDGVGPKSFTTCLYITHPNTHPSAQPNNPITTHTHARNLASLWQLRVLASATNYAHYHVAQQVVRLAWHGLAWAALKSMLCEIKMPTRN